MEQHHLGHISKSQTYSISADDLARFQKDRGSKAATAATHKVTRRMGSNIKFIKRALPAAGRARQEENQNNTNTQRHYHFVRVGKTLPPHLAQVNVQLDSGTSRELPQRHPLLELCLPLCIPLPTGNPNPRPGAL